MILRLSTGSDDTESNPFPHGETQEGHLMLMLHPPARHQDLCNDFRHIALKDSSLSTGILVDLDMLEKWRGDPKLTPQKKPGDFESADSPVSCGLEIMTFL